MPLLHCNKCHHEWEDWEPVHDCAWCGSDGYILAPTTPLEDMLALVKEAGGWKRYISQMRAKREI